MYKISGNLKKRLSKGGLDVNATPGMPEYTQSKMKRLLLLAATTGYQTKIFAETAQSLGLDLVMATDRCHVLDDPWGDHAVPVRFEQPEAAAANLAQLAPPPDAIVAIGDRPAYIGALTAQAMGLPLQLAESVAACRNKFTAREKFPGRRPSRSPVRAPGAERRRESHRLSLRAEARWDFPPAGA